MPALFGVISDTHGLIRDEALRQLADVDSIIHAGDVGKPGVLDALRRIAPVSAVRGNVDSAAWAKLLPATMAIEVEHTRILVLHNLADLDRDLVAQGFAAVISGHSHRAHQEVRNGVLCLNPGSAGPRRFRLPLTVARMVVEGASVRAEIVPLVECDAALAGNGVQQIGSAVLFVDRRGRAIGSRDLAPPTDDAEVAFDREGSVISELQFLRHALSWWGHSNGLLSYVGLCLH